MQYINRIYPIIDMTGNLFYYMNLRYNSCDRMKEIIIKYKIHTYFKYTLYLVGSFIEYKITYN